ARPSGRDAVVQRAAEADAGSAGLPVGVQVVGRPWRDHVVLAAMRAIEAGVTGGSDFPAAPIDPREWALRAALFSGAPRPQSFCRDRGRSRSQVFVAFGACEGRRPAAGVRTFFTGRAARGAGAAAAATPPAA